MSTKSIVEQAASVLAAPWSASGEQLAQELQSAGLLVSERDVLCREYADSHLVYTFSASGERRFFSAEKALRAYDREHAPKSRYYVEAFTCGGPDTHRVIDRSRSGRSDVRGFGTEAECIAIVNALAEKEAAK